MSTFVIECLSGRFWIPVSSVVCLLSHESFGRPVLRVFLTHGHVIECVFGSEKERDDQGDALVQWLSKDGVA